MASLQILTEIANTAQLVEGDRSRLILQAPGGYLLRLTTPRPRKAGSVTILSEHLKLGYNSTGTALVPAQVRLAQLPALPLQWSDAPEARWPQVRVFLHDHAGRPDLLLRLLTTICLPFIPHGSTQVSVSLFYGKTTARVCFDRQEVQVPMPDRTRILALQRMTVRGSKSVIVDTTPEHYFSIPTSMHERLEWTQIHGTAEEQLARLEAAWLGHVRAGTPCVRA